MPRYVLLNSIPGIKPGTIIDTDQGQNPDRVSSVGGVLTLLPNSAIEAAVVETQKAYARGWGDDVAAGIMAAAASTAAGQKALGRSIYFAAGGDAASDKSLQALVDLAPSRPSIIADSGASPIGFGSGTWDMRHAMFWADWTGAPSEVDVTGDGVVRNINWLLGTRLKFHDQAKLEMDAPPGQPKVVIMAFGGGIYSDAPSAPIVVAPGELFIAGGVLGGALDGSGGGPIIEVGPGAFLYALSLVSTAGPTIPAGSIVGDPAALLVYGHDGTFAGWPSLPGFLGMKINYPVNGNGGRGPTADRPVNVFGPDPVIVGWTYYDEEVDKPIVVNTALDWVDYSGAPV